SQKTYEEVFDHLYQNLKYQPEFINIYFEMSLYNALEKCSPNTRLKGCAFHFSQILIIYFKPRFIDKYKHDKALKMVTFCYFLAFVPKDKIEYEFNKISHKYKDVDLAFYEFNNTFY
ncbi:hypothetical protein DMUE_4975, partial [Dictyocoela muelleri]